MYGIGSESDDAFMYYEADNEIRIDELRFDKQGCLFIDYYFGIRFHCTAIQECIKPFDSLVPDEEGEYQDEDGLWNATLDDFHNLYWHCKTPGGKIVSIKHPIRDIVMDFLRRKHDTDSN
jgi:hypothetical protein